MTEERSFQLLESTSEPAVHQSPNYWRLVQAYRSYAEQGASAQECAMRLTEITHPGLRRYHFPSVPSVVVEGQEHSERLNGLLHEMVDALNSGDRASLARHFQAATHCFQELSALAVRGS